MQATLTRNPTRLNERQASDFTHALMKSLLDRDGATYTVDAASPRHVNRVATATRACMLFLGSGTGGVSATVSPAFVRHGYPAMLSLVGELNKAGAGDSWKPDGERSVRLGEAAHIFVSADSPLKSRTDEPDTLLEVPGAHLIEPHWFESRVVPRSSKPGLVRVLYGLPGRGGIYDRFRHRNLVAQKDSGRRRHFSLVEGRVEDAVSAW